MVIITDTALFFDDICKMLAEGNTPVAAPIAGGSMCPFLHHGDKIFLKLPGGRLKRGDIALYVRPSGQYVLHRVVKVKEKGYIFSGDFQCVTEWVAEDSIRAVASGAVHKGRVIGQRSLRWIFYATVWVLLRRWRKVIFKIKGN